MVFLKVKMSLNLIISPDKLDPNVLLFGTTIVQRLLEEFSIRRATEQYGYYVAVDTLEHLGVGKVRELSGDVLFPVEFNCITLRPFKGEVLDGMVDKVLKQGIFLKSGPMEEIFIHAQTMNEYEYVPGENPFFLNESHSKLEKGGIVRFKILSMRWKEFERSFRILGTLAGDFLGAIA